MEEIKKIKVSDTVTVSFPVGFLVEIKYEMKAQPECNFNGINQEVMLTIYELRDIVKEANQRYGFDIMKE